MILKINENRHQTMVLARPTEYLEAMIEACETYLED
jgi:hypothetical protein